MNIAAHSPTSDSAESRVKRLVLSAMLYEWIERAKAGKPGPRQFMAAYLHVEIASEGMNLAAFISMLNKLERENGVVKVVENPEGQSIVELADPTEALMLLGMCPAWAPDDLANSRNDGFLASVAATVGSLGIAVSQEAHDDGAVSIRFSPRRGGIEVAASRSDGAVTHQRDVRDAEIVFRGPARRSLSRSLETLVHLLSVAGV